MMVMSLKNRVKKIFKKRHPPVDKIIIKNGSETNIDPNFFYSTGIDKGLFEECAAVLYPNGDIDLIISKLEESIATDYNHNIIIFKNKKELDSILKKQLKDTKDIGLNFDGLSHRDFEFITGSLKHNNIKDVSEDLMKARMIKDSEEISQIKKACHIADKVAGKIPDFVSKGMHEYELAAEIDYYIQRYGADKPAFLTISSFGQNTSKPHYSHGDNKIEYGDIILCDFGACYRRYNSDITRAFVFGKASEKQKKIHETVFNAQKVGFEKIKPKIQARKVHEVVNDLINNTGFKDLFIHSTGHSLGLEVHDGGVGFNSGCDVLLSENMVLTVEPGIYKPNFGGIRIEDDILIKNEGIEILTKSDRSLIEI